MNRANEDLVFLVSLADGYVRSGRAYYEFACEVLEMARGHAAYFDVFERNMLLFELMFPEMDGQSCVADWLDFQAASRVR